MSKTEDSRDIASKLTRKGFLSIAVAGLASAALPENALAQVAGSANEGASAGASEAALTPQLVTQAEPLVGVKFPEAARAAVARGVIENRKTLDAMREIALENTTAPAFIFKPLGQQSKESSRIDVRFPSRKVLIPAVSEEIAWLSVAELGTLLRARQITSVELTKFFLQRLETYGPRLNCVINLMPERALTIAAEADRLFAQKKVLSPIQGIPTAIKDLFATIGTPTTWGAEPYRDQRIAFDAAVVERLEKAHAPILAKTSLGALAYGDIWFGGQTKNPWNPKQGSSGSSAGSSAAVAAGLVPFAIGTETLGSVISPSQRCRIVGLRPTFGRISRYGAMALSWTMDKVGVLARTPTDAALAFSVLCGADERDPTTVDRPFTFRESDNFKGLRVAVVGAEALDEDDGGGELTAAVSLLRNRGAKTSPAKFSALPAGATEVLTMEAAAAFDELTRSGRVDEMKGSLWPPAFRAAMYETGVDYIQAMRHRTLLMKQFEAELGDADIVLAPDRAGQLLITTNLTGHPQIYVPLGADKNGKPIGLSLIGRLYDEGRLLQVAQLLSERFGAPQLRPDLTKLPS